MEKRFLKNGRNAHRARSLRYLTLKVQGLKNYVVMKIRRKQTKKVRRMIHMMYLSRCRTSKRTLLYLVVAFRLGHLRVPLATRLQHVGSAGGVCPAWNKVDWDDMSWVSAAVCCSCSHGVDLTVFFHIKCGCSQENFISCFQMQLIIECFDNVQTWVFFAKSGGKINNHL